MSRSVEATRRRLNEERMSNDMETQPGQIFTSSSSSQPGQEPPPGHQTLEIEFDSPLKRNFKALLVLAVSVYGLREAKLLENLLWNKRVGSTALAVAVAASSVFVLLWAYLDVYVGTVQGQKVGYPEARRVTHTLLLSLLLILVSLTVAIWPVYQAAALVYVCMVSYGVMFQVVILLPASVYNPLFFCAYAGFVYMWIR